MRVDFSQIRLIPIPSVLALYKIETRKRNNTELVANCPFKSHEQSSHKEWTLAISTHKNKWYCHSDSCRAAGNHPKGGDVVDLVSRMESLTLLDAAKKLSELFCLGEGERRKEFSTAKPEPATEGNKPLAFALKGINPEHPFVQAKGITVETAKLYGVGFFPGAGSMANRVVFPLWENALVGYAGRTILDVTPDNPKWKLPQGLQKTFLYGLEKCDPAKILIVAESLWAPLFFHQKQWQAASLMGSTMTEEQEACLAPFQDIVIAMDNDPAGREAARKIQERLKRTHKVFRAYLKD